MARKYEKLSQKRFRFITSEEKKLERQIKRMENRIFRAVLEFLLAELVFEDGKIKTVAKNLISARNLRIVQQEFVDEVGVNVVKGIAKAFIGLHNLNERYFKALLPGRKSRVANAGGRILTQTNAKIGYKAGNIVKGGFLHDLANSQSVFDRIKQEALKAIASGESLNQFRGRLDEFIKGKGDTDGEVRKYWKRMTYDIYMQHDAQTQLGYANDLGLVFAVYQGGLIESSRPFCIERNDRIYHKSEIEKFGTASDRYGGYTNKSAGEFQGKNAGYNPLQDRGGYNCRHRYDWISTERALRLRPDAKEFIN